MAIQPGDILDAPKSIIEYDRENHILYMIVKRGAVYTLSDVMRKFELARTLIPTGKVLVVTDIRNLKNYSADVRAFYASPQANALIERLAVIVDSFPMRLAGNFFIHITKPTYPTRLFSRPEEGASWLLENKS